MALLAVGLDGRSALSDGSEFSLHYERAVSLYLSERYSESLQEFKAAYKAKQLPRLLINIGQAERKLGQAKEAIAAYQDFLRLEPNPDPALRKKIDDYLEQARALLTPPAAEPSPPPTKAAPAAGHGKRPPAVALQLVEKRSGRRFPTVRLTGIAGESPSALWITDEEGRICSFDGRTSALRYQSWGGGLKVIASRRADDVWAAGSKGLVLHYDGQAWFRVPVPTERELIGVWTGGVSETWVMDDSGAVLRWDGTDWADAGGEPPEGLSLSRLHAVTAADVWAVGQGGAVVHWDGKGLTRALSGTAENLYAVWAAAPGDVWAAGWHGTLLHKDGPKWTAVPSGTTKGLFGLWGSGPRDIWAIGVDESKGNVERWSGTILHYDGSRWAPAVQETPRPLWGVWGSGPRDVYAVGAAGGILNENYEPPIRTHTNPRMEMSGKLARSSTWAPRETSSLVRSTSDLAGLARSWTENLPTGYKPADSGLCRGQFFFLQIESDNVLAFFPLKRVPIWREPEGLRKMRGPRRERGCHGSSSWEPV